MKIINKLLSISFLLFSAIWIYAEETTVVMKGTGPVGPGGNPNGGGGGTGPVGPGAPASPIDMYIYALGIVAILFIIYFTKSTGHQKA